MKRYFASLLLAGALAVGAANAADVVIRVGPPRPVHVGPVGVAPGPGYVWTNGYHEYAGGHYVWHEGVWVRPPHEHAHWVEHRWVHRNGGYVFEQGHWR
jgi:hypothetical protein